MKNFLFLFLILYSFVKCDEVHQQFELANELYRKGEYEQALSKYEQIIKNGYISSDLYYNIGNVYFKLENIPAAILYYERAKRLSPNDEDIDFNLKIANLRVVDKIDPLPKIFFINWWYSISNINNSENWAIIAIIFSWISIGLFLVFRISKISIIKKSAFMSGSILLIFMMLVLSFAYTQYRYETDNTTGIIFSNNASVKSSPDEAGTDLFVIHEGVKVEILDEVGNWKKIRLADGKVGWIVADDIQII
ncbi:MAG: BatE [Ignavibacteriae bacterium]|nr:MAG: BatE [Ignavibacteriota bacterium]